MELYDVLKELNINYEEVEHTPVYTVQDVKDLKLTIKGTGCKNLFLKNKKKEYYLLIMQEDKVADIKDIGKRANASHLSFGNETELKDILDLERGYCSPFGIINDTENKVVLIIDRELKGKKLLFHPNRNTATLSIDYKDLIKFIEYEKHEYRFV